MSALTQADLEAGYDHPDWGGFGYLGGRRNALTSTDPEAPAQPRRVASVDALVLERANAAGWDRDRLFEWANHKLGRWFADSAFGGPDEPLTDEDRAALLRWHLV